ncbi:hypothetical protein VPH35_055298 [Triticum aestivum]
MKSSKTTETLKAVDLGLGSMDASEEEESDSSEEEEVDGGEHWMDSDSEKEAIQWPPTPPAYGYPDDGQRQPFVLIDQFAYLADRDNATTATTTAEFPAMGSILKGPIKVTFCPVAPPLVSYLCFHATDMDHTMFPVQPKILTTETDGGLLVLRAVVGTHPSDSVLLSKREYFVYDARAAKLHHLPHPGRQHEFDEYTLAIVRNCSQHCKRTTTTHHDSGGLALRPCHAALRHHGHGLGLGRHGHGQEHHHDCTYVVAAQALEFGDPETSHLCLYHSDTKTWSKKPVVVNSYPPLHETSKTLNIGGDRGTVAWVDLWRGIIFCDVLDEQPKLRCLELPKPIMPIKEIGCGDPRSVRDIAVVGNFIKFVDMHVHFDSYHKTSHHWKAVTWSVRTSSFSPTDWVMGHRIKSTRLRPQSALDKLMVDAGNGIKAPLPTLSTLHVGLPSLSLQDDDIVYFLAKIDYRQSRHTAWVLALDMRNKTVKEVDLFDAKRTLGLGRGYEASRISAYLKPALDPMRIPKRSEMPLLKAPSKKRAGDDAM